MPPVPSGAWKSSAVQEAQGEEGDGTEPVAVTSADRMCPTCGLSHPDESQAGGAARSDPAPLAPTLLLQALKLNCCHRSCSTGGAGGEQGGRVQ